MDRVSKLMVFLIVAVTLPALLVAARPAETQKCTIDGDIISNPKVVEIGLGGWVLRDGESDAPASLFLKGSLLQECGEQHDPTGFLYADIIVDKETGQPNYVSCTGSGPCDPTDPQSLHNFFEYYGHVVVSKKYGRFDFEFGPLLGFDEEGKPIPCVSPTYKDPMPYEDDLLCPYRLIIIDGLYNRTADVLTLDESSRVGLMDYTYADYSRDGNVYHVGDGPVSYDPGITVEFQPDGGGGGGDPEPERGGKKCKDEVDNDLDELEDCDDPDCAKWCP